MGIFGNKSADGGHADAVRQFNRLKEGETLPREGACSFFYSYFSYAGETLPLGVEKKFSIFHIENDDVIQEILAGTPSWHIQADGDMLLISILFKTGSTINHIQLPLDTLKEESMQFLGFLKGAKKVTINLLNFVYGSIIKEKVIEVPVPGAITAEIKKAVG